MNRCLKPQTSPEKAFKGAKHLLIRYLEDFGCLGIDSPANSHIPTQGMFGNDFPFPKMGYVSYFRGGYKKTPIIVVQWKLANYLKSI